MGRPDRRRRLAKTHATMTRMCKFADTGCKNGDKCPFAHHSQDLRAHQAFYASEAIAQLTPLLSLTTPGALVVMHTDPKADDSSCFSDVSTDAWNSADSRDTSDDAPSVHALAPHFSHQDMSHVAPMPPQSCHGFRYEHAIPLSCGIAMRLDQHLPFDISSMQCSQSNGTFPSQSPWESHEHLPYDFNGDGPPSLPSALPIWRSHHELPPQGGNQFAMPVVDMTELERVLREAASTVYED